MVMFGAAVAMAVALVALTVSAHVRRSTVLTQKLFDVDGPSVRDPSRAAWDSAGKVCRKMPLPNLYLYSWEYERYASCCIP